MEQFIELLEKIAIFSNGLLILLLGPLNIQLYCVFILVVCDLILGVMASRKNKTFNKKYFLSRTIEKTIIYLVWIVIGHTFDIIIKMPDVFRGIVVIIMASHEFASALRSTKELGYNTLAHALEKRVGPLIKKETKEEENEEGLE